MTNRTTIDDLAPTDWSERIDEYEAQGMSTAEAVNRVLSDWTRSDLDLSKSCVETRHIRRMDGRALR